MRPYLSLVIPTQNHDHPSCALTVQNTCLALLQRQLEEHRIASEILVIDYNPLPDRPVLSESLRVPSSRGCVTVQVITVPPEYHRQFADWRKKGFHQTCAVNVGIRRARGEFLVYRAADHVYSEALVTWLGRRPLSRNGIYRCDRVDFDPAAWTAIDPLDPAGASRIAAEHAVMRHRPLGPHPIPGIPTLHSNGCGDFLLMARETWLRLRGLREGRRPVFLDYDSLALHAAHAMGNVETVLPDECCVFKLKHGLRSVDRLEQIWTERWLRFEELLRRNRETPDTITRWRMFLNYPRRRDKTFPGRLLASYERHFLLPAWLWSRGFPLTAQNYGSWGLPDADLPVKTLTRAAWDGDAEPVSP